MTTTELEARAYVRRFMPPITILLICIPLVFGWIPRNGLYGIRVKEAFASDNSWYAINQLGGIALIGACVIWILAAAYAPARLVKVIGVGAIVLTLVVLVMTQGWTL